MLSDSLWRLVVSRCVSLSRTCNLVLELFVASDLHSDSDTMSCVWSARQGAASEKVPLRSISVSPLRCEPESAHSRGRLASSEAAPCRADSDWLTDHSRKRVKFRSCPITNLAERMIMNGSGKATFHAVCKTRGTKEFLKLRSAGGPAVILSRGPCLEPDSGRGGAGHRCDWRNCFLQP